MGSGCNSSCNDFFKKIPDNQIQYTGVAIPALGICTNDKLSEVEGVLLQKIIDYSTGIGISLPNIDLSTCALFVSDLTCCSYCTDLPCLMEAYKTGLCTLYGDVTALQTAIGALSGPYNTGCLTNVTGNSTLTAIIQELILEFCALKATVTSLQTQVTSLTSGINTSIGSFLLSALTSCTGTGNVIKSGTGATASVAFKGFVPVGAIIPYAGTTVGKFDATGLGLTGTDMCGFAIANSNNGTSDMRGFVPVGAINGMGGGTLNPIVVDAGASPSAAYSLGDVGGQIRHQLTDLELASHNHPGSTVSPHSHPITGNIDFKGGAGNSVGVLTTNIGAAPDYVFPSNQQTFTQNTGNAIASLSIASDGKDIPHENRMPYKALLYIQRIS